MWYEFRELLRDPHLRKTFLANNNVKLDAIITNANCLLCLSFVVDHRGNAEPTLTHILHLFSDRGGNKSCTFLSRFSRLPQTRRFSWASKVGDDAWITCDTNTCYSIGSEILIGLSANLWECNYYEHFGPQNFTTLFFQENIDFYSESFADDLSVVTKAGSDSC